MPINFNTTFISMITLTFLITSSLSWLTIRTLKEGREAINEIKKNSK